MLRSNDMTPFSVKRYTAVKQHVTELGCNHLQMPRNTMSPAVRFAKNLEILIELHQMTVAQVAAIAKVIPKQVYNLLNVSHDPRLKGLEKVAGVFGLTAWQMLAMDLTTKPAENRRVLALLEDFAAADADGQAAILQVAAAVASKAYKRS